MIYLASFLFGGISGVVLWCYVSVFITCLQKDIYDAYIELFPENAPFFNLMLRQFNRKSAVIF